MDFRYFDYRIQRNYYELHIGDDRFNIILFSYKK